MKKMGKVQPFFQAEDLMFLTKLKIGISEGINANNWIESSKITI
jgi:hypothetical protein